jgi:hypothetical protein
LGCSPTPTVVAPTVRILLKVYDSSGLVQRSLDMGLATSVLNAFNLSADPYNPDNGPLTLSQGAWSFAFDGHDAQGDVLRNGVYVLEIESRQGGGSTVVRKTVQVVGSGAPMVVLIGAPNPVRPGSGQAVLSWQPNLPVDVNIYSLDGELVRGLGRLNSGPLDWDLRDQAGSPVADGIYWIAARRPGERLPSLFKLMVAR